MFPIVSFVEKLNGLLFASEGVDKTFKVTFLTKVSSIMNLFILEVLR